MPTFKSLYKFMVPAFLYRGDGGKVLDALTDLIDESVARVRAGLEARFPSRAQPDTLAMLGQDRGIPRGRSETAEHYAQRLIGWRYPRGHRVRGSAFAALNQISEYFGGIACWSIDVNGNRHDHAADGTESFSYGNAWNWDATSSPRGRFWFVLNLQGIASPNPKIGSPLLWGNKIGPAGRGYAIGHQGVAASDAAAIARLFTSDVPWKPAGTMQQYAVITFDGSTPAPTGNWQLPSGRFGSPYRFWYLGG